MKAAYYIRIQPHRILVVSDKYFLTKIPREERDGWQRIEAWNKYHAKQLGMEYKKVMEELTRDTQPTSGTTTGRMVPGRVRDISMITHYVRFGWTADHDIVSTLNRSIDKRWVPVEDCETMNEAKQKAREYRDCLIALEDEDFPF